MSGTDKCKALLLLLLTTTTTVVWGRVSDDTIISAFKADGFNVTKSVTFNSQRGFVAESQTATVLGTGQPKRAYYVEGNGFELGMLMGLQACDIVEQMAGTFVDRFIPMMISQKLARRLENDPIFEDLEAVVGEFLTFEANKAFMTMYDQGVFPATLIDEMRGVVAGCAQANPNTQVTFSRMVTVNFAMDWLSAHVFGGRLGNDRLYQRLRNIATSMRKNNVINLLSEMTKATDLFREPAYCDAFGVTRSMTTTGTTIFARDFQFVTCDVFQDIAALTISVPNDGREATVALHAPGLVGSITIMNARGIAMGVDTLRSAFANLDAIGLNSALLIRHIGDTAKSTANAVDMVAAAPRGCPFLYPLCDAGGDCVIIESGAYSNITGTAFDPLQYVSSHVKSHLPTSSFIQQHSSAAQWHAGTYVRGMNWSYPSAYLDFNPGLFSMSGSVYNASAFGGPGSYIFDSWQSERDNKLENNFFTPLRVELPATNDYVLVSNLALVPEMRMTMMSTVDDLFTMTDESPQWRYDKLTELLNNAKGTIDIDKAKDIITFLSPDKTPGYWNTTINPNDPMSAQIMGAIAVADLNINKQQLVLHAKTGYWADQWIQISLLNYL